VDQGVVVAQGEGQRGYSESHGTCPWPPWH
jgi:hypothetical protein